MTVEEWMHRTSIIVDTDDWIEFDRVAKRLKTDRASLIRTFIERQVAEHRNVPATASTAA
jgi:hypothetical protein